MEEKAKEQNDDINEIEQKNEERKNVENNLKEEKIILKEKRNHQNEKSPFTPLNHKSAKVKINFQNSEIELVRFSFQTSLSKLAKNETREIVS